MQDTKKAHSLNKFQLMIINRDIYCLQTMTSNCFCCSNWPPAKQKVSVSIANISLVSTFIIGGRYAKDNITILQLISNIVCLVTDEVIALSARREPIGAAARCARFAFVHVGFRSYRNFRAELHEGFSNRSLVWNQFFVIKYCQTSRKRRPLAPEKVSA